jgi:DNA replication licensing factor MCM3
LLLQPTDFLPALDTALLQLVQALHDPVKHRIAGNECEFS